MIREAEDKGRHRIEGKWERQMCKCESPEEEKENTLLHPDPQTGVRGDKTERPEQPDYILKLEYKWTFSPKRLLTLPNITHYESYSVQKTPLYCQNRSATSIGTRGCLCTPWQMLIPWPA